MVLGLDLSDGVCQYSRSYILNSLPVVQRGTRCPKRFAKRPYPSAGASMLLVFMPLPEVRREWVHTVAVS